MKQLLFIALMCIPLCGSKVHAQNRIAQKCEVPGVSVISSVTEYAVKKYHVTTSGQLTLRESIKANDECYWKYHFETSSPRQDIVLYLAPDHRYLTTTLYDRLSDPLAEEKLQRDQMARSLVGNGSPTRGPQDASVTIVEFSDFQCPYCLRLTNILEKEVLPGEPDVRVVFKNFPLPMHPFARSAAQADACAAMQSSEAFWTLHDYTFGHQRDLTADNVEQQLTTFADQQPGIDHKSFHDCMDRGLSVGPVMKDEELGRKVGVHATPTIFLNGSRIEGVRDAAQLKQLIAQARLGQLPPTPMEAPQAFPTARPTAQGNACAPTGVAAERGRP